MFVLAILVNGIEFARQYHDTYEDAMVAAARLIPSVQMELRVFYEEQESDEDGS